MTKSQKKPTQAKPQKGYLWHFPEKDPIGKFVSVAQSVDLDSEEATLNEHSIRGRDGERIELNLDIDEPSFYTFDQSSKAHLSERASAFSITKK